MEALGSVILSVDVNITTYAQPVAVSGQGVGDPIVARNPPPVAPPDVANVFMGTLLNNIGFYSV